MHYTEQLNDNETHFCSVPSWPFAKFCQIGAKGTLCIDYELDNQFSEFCFVSLDTSSAQKGDSILCGLKEDLMKQGQKVFWPLA